MPSLPDRLRPPGLGAARGPAWRSAECETNQHHVTVNSTPKSKPLPLPHEMPGGTSASRGTWNCGLEHPCSADTRVGCSAPALRARPQATHRPLTSNHWRGGCLGPTGGRVTHRTPVTVHLRQSVLLQCPCTTRVVGDVFTYAKKTITRFPTNVTGGGGGPGFLFPESGHPGNLGPGESRSPWRE